MSEEKTPKEQEADSLLGSIKIKLDKATGLVAEIQTALGEAKSKAATITNRNTSSETKFKEIESKHSAITGVEGSVNTLLQQIQTKVSDAELLDKRLIELKQKMEDGTTGVDATLKSISEKKDEAIKTFETVSEKVRSIEITKKSAIELKAEIESFKEEVEGHVEEIEKMYGYITGAGLSHSFTEQQNELKTTVQFWRTAVILSVMFLGAILGYLLHNQVLFSGPWYEAFLYKLSYSSPGIFLLSFSTLQYSRAQRLMDSYAFKAATAKALENYTEVLERRFDNEVYKKDILEFVLSSMKNIYKHPSSESVCKEDRTIEHNPIEHIESAIKEVTAKIIEPVTSMISKVKKVSTVD